MNIRDFFNKENSNVPLFIYYDNVEDITDIISQAELGGYKPDPDELPNIIENTLYSVYLNQKYYYIYSRKDYDISWKNDNDAFTHLHWNTQFITYNINSIIKDLNIIEERLL